MIRRPRPPGDQWRERRTRFGVIVSAFFAVATTLTSTGAVDSFHSSYSGLGGGVLMLNMMLGEIAPGGVGSGLYGMLVVAIVAVFVCGLMVGRTPEFLGKKIGRKEITLASIYMTHLTDIGTRRNRRRDDVARSFQLDSQCRFATRTLRNPLRIHLGIQQQRVRFRGTRCQHPILQYSIGSGNVHRPPGPDLRDPRPGRSVRGTRPHQGVRRHPTHPPTPVRWRDRRRGPHLKRIDIPPSARSGTDQRRVTVKSRLSPTPISPPLHAPKPSTSSQTLPHPRHGHRATAAGIG